MNRHNLDTLWRHVRWSHFPDVRDEGTIHKTHQWKFVEDFATHFNEYCTQIFSPSDLICADESISQWYRKGGHWINLGLPMYVEMYRKTENWAEIHNYSCGWSEIMMRLGIFKSAKNEEYQQDNEYNLPHGTKPRKELVIPWANKDRIIWSDSYFTSVPADEELWKNGLRFIGVIKTSMWKFPMATCLKQSSRIGEVRVDCWLGR